MNDGSTALAAASLMPVGCRVEVERVAGRRRFVRCDASGDDVSGWRSYMESESGLCVCVGHVRYRCATTMDFPTPASIMKIHVRLSGTSRVGGTNEPGRYVAEMSCSALIQPNGEHKFEHVDGAGEERSVTIACSSDFLGAGFGLEPDGLPAGFAHFLDGKDMALCGIDVPLLMETRRTAEAIFGEVASGAAGALLVESQALELLARFIEQVRRLEVVHAPSLPSRDRKLADATRRLLETCYANVPSLKSLAREVGTHPAKLMRVFKATHGSTISDYVESLRMERARQLLQDGDLPITQIAYEVGYEHPSNFATAFKRRFGSAPSALRSPGRSAGP